MTNIPLTKLLVESKEEFLVHAGCVGPYDTDHRCSALHCNHCGACEMTPFVDSLIRKAYLLGQSEEKERILSCGHAHELVHGFQPYGLMDEEKERAIFEDGFKDGRAMLMIDVLSKRDPRNTKEALDSAIGEVTNL